MERDRGGVCTFGHTCFHVGCVFYTVHCYRHKCIHYVNTFGLLCGNYGYMTLLLQNANVSSFSFHPFTSHASSPHQPSFPHLQTFVPQPLILVPICCSSVGVSSVTIIRNCVVGCFWNVHNHTFISSGWNLITDGGM